MNGTSDSSSGALSAGNSARALSQLTIVGAIANAIGAAIT
jgi:hypothetical protein